LLLQLRPACLQTVRGLRIPDPRALQIDSIEIFQKNLLAYLECSDRDARHTTLSVGLTPEAYKPLLKGAHLIDVEEGKKTFKKGPGLESLYGSSKIVDDFNVDNAVYKAHQDIDSYIDPSLTDAVK
jgi:hypothetical protein